MKQFDIELARHETREWLIHCEDRQDAIDRAERKNPGFKATIVNDEEIIGRCNGCGNACFDGDGATLRHDGWFCKTCIPVVAHG
jgi:hypothetical protein